MDEPPHRGNTESGETHGQGKPDTKQEDNRRDVRRETEIFKNDIKGIKKITGKYNTSKPLTEVKISCPCGLK